MSPEGAAYAMDHYLESLELQTKAAKAFALGNVLEGLSALAELPRHVRESIDKCLWQANQGEPVNLADPEKASMVVDAILLSLEERMGMHSPTSD